ncbi:MAG: hypothetical protein HY678_07450 [Chloroflexi bacterium]|nr:hypothetical protein [Chloroflexota bacterium]
MLTITLRSAVQSVSALSSLLREVQAALREAGRLVPESAHRFETEQPPVLTVGIEMINGGLALSFEFADALSRTPAPAISIAASRRLVAALEAELKRRPQRTLWGQHAASARRRATEQRDPLADRASSVLEELARVQSASVAVEGRRIEISGETVEIHA